MSGLVIFDLDGVLVDSERLAVRVERDVLANLGWHLDESEIVERFVGRSAEYMHAQVEGHLDRRIDWRQDFEVHYEAAFRRELLPVDGVPDVLSALTTTTCVASSSSHSQINLKLGLVGLLEHFSGRIFSADDVERPKPAPDVFELAARHFDVRPDRCVVIEDSVTGCQAGLAAGMRVLALATPLVPRHRLAELGVEIMEHISELPRLLHATSERLV